MRKRDLFNLTVEVRNITRELPVIVGSQAVFAVTDFPPEIVRRSVECDFLLLDQSFGWRSEITETLGIFSEYQERTGFYADVLGRATVVLPENWESRLVEMKDENGDAIALCVEIHDVAVSKMIAGREKDFEFLQTAFESDYLEIETFIERAETILKQSAAEVLLLRLQELIESFSRTTSLRESVDKLKEFKRAIEKEIK